MMKALVLDAPGSPDTLRLTELPRPQPGPGEVLVRVHAVGLNPVDYKVAQSGHPAWRYPFILGLDVAGTVAEVGEGVTAWQTGDAVYYHGDLSRPGGYAEWAVAAAHAVAPLPDGLSFVQAAALPCAGFTAYQALYRKLHIQPGQTVLVTGGAGGVGGFAVQLAARQGCEVIATCSAHNQAYVKKLGAAHTVDYTRENISERVRSLTNGRGVDAVVDTVSSASATEAAQLLAYNGGIACVAGSPDMAVARPFRQAASVHGVMLGGAHLSGDRPAQEDLARMGREFGALVSAGQIDPMLHEVIRMEEIPEALVRLSQRHVRGKIVAALHA
ncbi:MAG TPA: zinc-binding dehydrogenase [Symbiobacteriaceae bacterium]|jgi:NADPH:quinone reductase-like Zn-dependent oxidoreductase|nr:zinc-binding dehydrogenase [Symbiobacteriaceae bacterium]